MCKQFIAFDSKESNSIKKNVFRHYQFQEYFYSKFGENGSFKDFFRENHSVFQKNLISSNHITDITNLL